MIYFVFSSLLAFLANASADPHLNRFDVQALTKVTLYEGAEGSELRSLYERSKNQL